MAAVDGDALRELHRQRVLPAGSSLVLVGDLDPAAATEAVVAALAGWSATGHAVEAPPAPALRRARHRDRRPARRRPVQPPARRAGPGPHGSRPARRPAGQHDLRRVLLLPAGGEHPRAARLHLQPAQLRRPPGRRLVVPGRGRRRHGGDRARRCSRPRTSSGAWRSPPVTDAELDGARRYILGTMALSTATHAGLASTLSALVGAGLPAGWLADHQRALEAVTRRAGAGGRAALPGARGADRRRGRRLPRDRRTSCRRSAPHDRHGRAGPGVTRSSGRQHPGGQPAADRAHRRRAAWPEGTPQLRRRRPGAVPGRPRPGAPGPRAARPDRRPAGAGAHRRRPADRARSPRPPTGPRLVWDEQPELPAGRGLPRRGRRRPLRRRARRAVAHRQRPAGRHLGRRSARSAPTSATWTPACSCRRSASSSGTSATGSAR